MTHDDLLVLEVKKSTNPESSQKDLAKLQAFKDQLGYRNALFVRFLTGETQPGIQDLVWV